MNRKKKKKKWPIVLGIVLVMIFGGLFIFLRITIIESKNMVYGNNTSVYFYERGIGNQGYQNLTDAVMAKDKKYSEEKQVMSQTMGNVTIVFRQGTDIMGDNYVIGYEFIEKKGLLYYSGERKTFIDNNKAGKRYSWEETVAADLSNSTGKSYKKIIKLGENYDVRPAWGVSDYEKIGDMSVDGQGVDEVTVIDVDGVNYYLWMINDLKTENSAKNVVVE